jgi:hypothetical protein
VTPHVPFWSVIDGFAVVVALPCLQCILDAWAARAREGARAGVAYRPGSTNWAVRPVRVTLAERER